jgi:hypothetical protein
MTTTQPLHNIAISFSGGGFRAAAYNLGVISYLHTLTLNSEFTIEILTFTNEIFCL